MAIKQLWNKSAYCHANYEKSDRNLSENLVAEVKSATCRNEKNRKLNEEKSNELLPVCQRKCYHSQ